MAKKAADTGRLSGRRDTGEKESQEEEGAWPGSAFTVAGWGAGVSPHPTWLLSSLKVIKP